MENLFGCLTRKLVSSGNSRKAASPSPADLPLQNRFNNAMEDEGLGSMSKEEAELAETELCSHGEWGLPLAHLRMKAC